MAIIAKTIVQVSIVTFVWFAYLGSKALPCALSAAEGCFCLVIISKTVSFFSK